jgi:hypothetical protein
VRRPAQIGENVKTKRRYDEEFGKLKRKHEKMHRRLLYLAIGSELIFVANFMCPPFYHTNPPLS